MLKVGSLFSGAGLCDLGLHWAGFKHQWFCEVDAHCRAVLARHWQGVPCFGDITTLDGGELSPVDVLCGGFPCQDVSSGGQRAGIKEGTRSGVSPRSKECWATATNLKTYLIGLEYALTGRTNRPQGAHMADVSFVEWMMGVPAGWTEARGRRWRAVRRRAHFAGDSAGLGATAQGAGQRHCTTASLRGGSVHSQGRGAARAAPAYIIRY